MKPGWRGTRDSRQQIEIQIGKNVLTRRERNVKLDLHRRRQGKAAGVGEFALGQILVADGQITPHQLECALRRQAATGRRLGEELIQAGHANLSQVENGLLLQRKLVAYALAAAVGLVPLAAITTAAEAAQKSASMVVSVTVIANAKVRIDYQATQLNISAADIARGYIEIAAASRFSVHTNSRAGYLMEFHPVGNLFESVQVSGLGNAVLLGADGGAIVQRGPLPPMLSHELSFRFALRPDTQAGNYPWPLLLAVRPL